MNCFIFRSITSRITRCCRVMIYVFINNILYLSQHCYLCFLRCCNHQPFETERKLSYAILSDFTSNTLSNCSLVFLKWKLYFICILNNYYGCVVIIRLSINDYVVSNRLVGIYRLITLSR